MTVAAGTPSPAAELVNITIDGKQLRVPKGTNLIDAALNAGIEIPHYCYHPHLSIAGNCRMCQIAIQGQPKLAIACNTTATEGLNVQTQFSNPEVGDAQRATLEFLLINHPLDCTVCDQAGHCKLQDYHYQYNSKASRFLEAKVNKVKAEPLGPEVRYDGERCIMCTRCVRFCTEVTETSELGAFNRGDRGVIGVFPGKELDNPLSGSVVDLCPVGALTHERWRFNNRYWYANEMESVCPGCSTGCNAKIAVRDDQIVQVKGRLNSAVNNEWMCDEGRYGFNRFQPEVRLTEPHIRRGETFVPVSQQEAIAEAAKLRGSSGQPAEADTAVFLSPFLTMEEIWLAIEFSEQFLGLPAGSSSICVQIEGRELTPVQAKLVSPDYAPNARAASLFFGDPGDASWRSSLQARYKKNLERVRTGALRRIVMIGDLAIAAADLDEAFAKGVYGAELSLAITAQSFQWGGTSKGTPAAGTEPATPQGSLAPHGIGFASDYFRVLLPGRSVNEKNGVFVNKDMRVQRLKALFSAPVGTLPDWMFLNRIAAAGGKALLKSETTDDRSLFREMISRVPDLSKMTLSRVGPLGVPLGEILSEAKAGAASQPVSGSGAGAV